MFVQFSQPSTSRRRLRYEDQPFEHHTQPWLDPGLQQASLISLRNLHPGARALIIVLEFEALLIDGHQVVFEESFETNNKIQMVTQVSDNIEYYLYLQGPLNHLDSERRAGYIASVLCQILEFLHV